jgi:tetratricopeptide (TPR) repeat protein
LETLLRAAARLPHARRRAEELFTAHPDLADTATGATLRILAEWPAPARAVARRVFDDPRFHGDPLPAVLTRTLAREATDRLERAELHGLLAARAALASLHEEALTASREEVALYRELADEDPAEHRSALADAVADLSLRHTAVGRPEDALAACEEAVALCRIVAAEDRDCTSQLAGALDRLSRRYAALGRHGEALAAIEEATDLYRDLAEAHPKLFRVDLAKVTHQRSALARRDQ